MISEKNLIYEGSNNRLSVYDIEIPEEFNGKLVLFVHGYKGYKDWGAWNLVQAEFVKNGFGFVKMNLTHNGGTITNPIDFPDLDAFGKNRYSYEVKDIGFCLKQVQKYLQEKKIIFDTTHLIGHSRGGGDVILAGELDRISSIITWAGISSIYKRSPKIGSEEAEKWKKDKVRYVKNARTNQDMPHYYSMMEDLIENYDDLDIEKVCAASQIPKLHIHGDADDAVKIDEGIRLAELSKTSLKVIEGADHVFGAKQPWNSNELPKDLKKIVDCTIEFLKQ